jgi:hypothetical protein
VRSKRKEKKKLSFSLQVKHGNQGTASQNIATLRMDVSMKEKEEKLWCKE